MKKTILLILAMAGASIAGAATYYVSKSGDDGDGNDGLTWGTAKASIAAAVALASDSEADTIVVGDGDYTMAGAVTVAKPCTIESENGAENVTLHCAGAFIPFTLNHNSAKLKGLTLLGDNSSRAYNAVKVTAGNIDSCVITNFAASAEVVLFENNKNTHTMTDSIVVKCRYTSGQRMISPNNTTITRCQFINNTLDKGILMYASGTTMRNCLFAGNTSKTSTSPFLMNVYSGTFHNNTFAGNKTTKTGATAYSAVNLNGKTFVNCIFWGNTNPAGNSCDWSGGVGSATYCCSSTAGLTGTGCTTADPAFADAANGDYHISAGSCVDAGSNQSWMNSTTDLDGNNRIINDRVDIGCYEYLPGALECSALISSATVLVNEEVTITASVSGANLSNLTYAWAVTNMTDGTVSTYSDATVTAAFPCGTYSIGLTVGNGTETGTFTASPFFEVKPATVFVAKDGSQTWPYDTLAKAFTNIPDSVAFSAAGMTVKVADGVYTNTSNPVLSHAVSIESINGAACVMLVSPVASSAAWTISHAQAHLRGFTFIGDYAATRSTAVIAASAGTLADCVATNFTTSGTIFNASGACLFSNCVVTGCRTTGGWLVGLNNSGSMAENCRITGNTLAGAVTYLSSSTLRNCLVADNTTSAGAPFIVNNYNGSGTIENCTIANNRTTSTDAGAYAVIASGAIRNTILWNNMLPGGGIRDWSGTASVFSHCCSSTSGMTGAGCLTDDPRFAGPPRGDYRLKSGSRCIDAGINQAWMAGATDLDGNARIYGRRSIVDIGCYEFSRSMGTTLFVQ